MKEKVFFNDVQMCNIVDPSILTTPAFRLIEEDFGSLFKKVLLTYVIFVGSSYFEGMLIT